MTGRRQKNDSQSQSSPPSRANFDFPDDPFDTLQHRGLRESSHDTPAAQRRPESLSDWAKNTRFTVLNHFSQVTNVARNGAHTLMSSPLFRPPSPEDLRKGAGHAGVQRSAGAAVGTSLQQHGPIGPFGPSDPDWKHSELARKSGTSDFDSAHVYLARWAKIVAEEGEKSRQREEESISRATDPGISSSIRETPPQQQESATSSFPMEDSDVGAFEVWNRTPWTDRPIPTRIRHRPLTQAEWDMCFYADGTPVLSWSDVKAKIFERGLGDQMEEQPDEIPGSAHWDQLGARAEAWSFLLDAQAWSPMSTRLSRRQTWKGRVGDYWAAKASWSNTLEQERLAAEARQDSKVLDTANFIKDERHRVRVDCLRVDKKLPFFSESRHVASAGADYPSDNLHIRRLEDILLTYVSWDHDREKSPPSTTPTAVADRGQLGGYVQGMSDLCAPLYVLCGGDEAKTFWLFAGLMQKVRHNFYRDQSGMKMQLMALQKLIIVLDPGLHAHLESLDALNLFFCFRWLLVCFKREFDYPEILQLWEAMWSADIESSNDHLWAGTPEDKMAQTNGPKDPLTAADASGATTPSDAQRDQDSIEHRANRSKTSLSSHFQIFIAYAILQQQRDIIVKYLHHFDEILQYMNGLSGQLDVNSTLAEAQVACLCLRNLIALQRGESLPIGASDADDREGNRAVKDKSGAKRREESQKKLQRQQAAAALPPVDRELCALLGEDEP